MYDIPTRHENQSPADYLQERRRRTTRSASVFSAKDAYRASMIMARIESGHFDDEALALAIVEAVPQG